MAIRGGPDIVDDGLVLYLDAGNKKSYPGSGTTWTDLSGAGNNGTLVNGPTFDGGNVGSIVFDGVNDHVSTNLTLGNVFSSNGLEQLTVMFWHKSPSSASAYFNYLISNAMVSSTSLFSTGVWNTIPQFGTATFVILHEYGRGVLTWGGGAGFGYTPNEYAFHCFAVDFASGNQKYTLTSISPNNTGVFVNVTRTEAIIFDTNGNITGGFPTTQLETNPPQYTVTNQPFLIARRGNSYFGGNIALAGIYNKYLSNNEILQNFNATRSRFGV